MSETAEIDKASLKSKVLLVDTNKDILPVTKLFLDEANLIGVRANKSDVMEVLKSNVDLGAILLAESLPTARNATSGSGGRATRSSS